jgi:hypothetical protein
MNDKRMIKYVANRQRQLLEQEKRWIEKAAKAELLKDMGITTTVNAIGVHKPIKRTVTNGGDRE